MAVEILGMRGSGSFSADERPQNWRQAINLIFPNGDMPLLGLLSMCPEEPTDDPQVNWFEKSLPITRGTLIGASLTNTANPGTGTIAATTGTLNAEIAIALQPDGGSSGDVGWVLPGFVIIDEVTEEAFTVLKVDTVAQFIVARRNIGQKAATTGALKAVTANDTVSVIGSSFQEGAQLGNSLSFGPIRHYNFTQIFRDPLSLSRTARRTKLRYDRTGPYRELKRETYQRHGLSIEKALMFGEREEITSVSNAAMPLVGGSNAVSSGNPMRTMRGMLNWLPAASTSVATPSIHWDLGTANSGGLNETLADAWFEELFRYGSSEKVCFAGSTALNVLNQLAKNKLTIHAVPSDRTYGMQFNRYITPFGELLVKQHPLMSHNPVWRKDLLVIDLPHLRLRVLDETTFLRNRQNPGDDQVVDEFLSELSLECRFSGTTPTTAGGLSGTAGPAVHGRLKGITSLAG